MGWQHHLDNISPFITIAAKGAHLVERENNRTVYHLQWCCGMEGRSKPDFFSLPETNIAMENPPFWWYLPGKMGIFMGYVRFREGNEKSFVDLQWSSDGYPLEHVFFLGVEKIPKPMLFMEHAEKSRKIDNGNNSVFF